MKTDKSTFTAKAAEVFKAYPDATELFFTADGQSFLKESPAKNHARSLNDKEVTTITRAEAEAAKPAAKVVKLPIKKIVTQEDVDANPELADLLGQEIEIPAEEIEGTEETTDTPPAAPQKKAAAKKKPAGKK